MGLYDNVLAQARQTEAMAAIDVPAEQCYTIWCSFRNG